MKKIKYYLIVASLILCLPACQKYLNAKSDASLVTPKQLADYAALLDNSNVMNIRVTPSFQATSSDDYFLLPATFNSFSKTSQSPYLWQPVLYSFANDWSRGYQAIYNANLVLEGVSAIPVNNANREERNRIMGSAYFFRSFFMTNLLWNHGKAFDESTADQDLGIVLKLNSEISEKSVRATIRQCYHQVLQDAQQAAQFLPKYELSSMRPSRVAAYALLGRICLSMRDYQKMFNYADSSLVLKSNLINYNGDSDINSTISGTIPFKKFNKETLFYTEMSTSFTSHIPSRAKIDTVLFKTYRDHDLRKIGYFKANSGYQQFKGSYASNPSLLFSGIGVDEVWLMHAEGHSRAGRTQAAMKDLNHLLLKRWDSHYPYEVLTAIDEADALSKILLERRKELLMRGLRWIDIKRLNKEGREIKPARLIEGKLFRLFPNDPYYALPLPNDLIELTGMPQN